MSKSMLFHNPMLSQVIPQPLEVSSFILICQSTFVLTFILSYSCIPPPPILSLPHLQPPQRNPTNNQPLHLPPSPLLIRLVYPLHARHTIQLVVLAHFCPIRRLGEFLVCKRYGRALDVRGQVLPYAFWCWLLFAGDCRVFGGEFGVDDFDDQDVARFGRG